MRFALRVEHVSKKYRLPTRVAGGYRTLREDLAHVSRAALERLRRRRKEPLPVIWALRDLSLEIEAGEVLGIIGRNGAGKSTLLKVLSRVTRPTEGRVFVAGRVGSLLEVGTGFHPELTGRENIFLNGAVLGMSRREIAAKFDDIVDFAETARFLDLPVKHYSTGMHMRLAFAVAAHLQPEILLVDEVLAVGDAAFQRKCLGRMEGMAHSGRTVIMISHNMSAVQALATRVAWIEAGVLRGTGAPHEIVQQYLMDQTVAANERRWDDPAGAPGSESVRLCRVAVRRNEQEPLGPITVRTPVTLEFEYWNFVDGAKLNLSVVLTNLEGVIVFNTFPVDESGGRGTAYPAGLLRSTCWIPGDFLNDGTYFVQLYVVADESRVLSRHDSLLSFTVLDSADRGTNWHGKWIGAVRPALKWQTDYLSSRLEEGGG